MALPVQVRTGSGIGQADSQAGAGSAGCCQRHREPQRQSAAALALELGGRHDGQVRQAEGQVEEERPARLGTLVDIGDRLLCVAGAAFPP